MLLAPIWRPEQDTRPHGQEEGGRKGPDLPVALKQGDNEGGQESQAVKHQ